MKIELINIGPLLKAKNEATKLLMESLVIEKAQVDEVRQVVLADEAIVKVKAEETQGLADEAQRDLGQALPAMEAATKALEALNKNDINELRVFIKPPTLVKFVMEAVCLLLGVKQDWATSKQVLGEGNFLKKLQEYEKDKISDQLLKKLKAYIDHPDFIPEKVESQSKVCKSICEWVRAIDTYAKVYRIVEPKRKKFKGAEAELNAIMGVLRKKQQSLAEVEAHIAGLEAKYDASLAEKAKLEATIELCSARLNRAGRLTEALEDEQIRWELTVKRLGEELTNVQGNVLVAGACVAYLGAFTSNYREELSATWLQHLRHLNIPVSQTFSLIEILADQYEIRRWNSFGLPKDEVSTENAIYVTNASRWPLMIDPQEQANQWIRQMEAENQLKMVKMTDGNFTRVLEVSLRMGLPLLIVEAGESLDPTLRPILLKQFFLQGGRYLVRLGDTDVDWDPKFKLYITTKLANPHYLPEVCIQVTLVNFTVTPLGLEDQLLAEVVRLERPELEKQRSELIVRINRDKAQLKAIEDRILNLLFASEGNILDNEELVCTLNESKETSGLIGARLCEAEDTEMKISIAREGYRAVASRGSLLYFVVAQLAEIDPMYQFSLRYFSLIFNTVIETTEKCDKLDVRLSDLIEKITVAIYNNVSRGLFEKHKLVFSFLLCVSLYRQSGIISDDMFNFLLRGPIGAIPGMTKKPGVVALSDNSWYCCWYLASQFKNFKELPSSVLTDITISVGDYTLVIKLGGEDSVESTIDWENKLDLFEKIMLIKALKEEKLVFAATEYVKVLLGKQFVESPMINLHKVFEDTSNVVPLIFVLSPGCDPVSGFMRFAAESGNTERISSISLGQGQGPIAANMIESGAKKGDWVFLQNCHLASSWMVSMEEMIMGMREREVEVHKEFRLFLSSMPSKAFPVSVLQNSVKVTNEPPKGLRANIQRAFAQIKQDLFEQHGLGEKWRKMIFGLCFFHAVILERKKFGPLGWNILYEFSDSDRECALLNLQLFCTSPFIPWDALIYITGEITYGGRVTDIWDQRTLKTILHGFFSPHTLKTGYKYSGSGTYYCPESHDCQSLDKYIEFIDELPLIEEPEIFGMHENANLAFQWKETEALIGTMVEIQPKAGGGAEGLSPDEIVYSLAAEIRHKILSIINQDAPHPSLIQLDDKGRVPSLTTVLMQEIGRFNRMLCLIHSSLSDLQKGIKGLVVMSDSLEEIFKAFINNQIPRLWSHVGYPSLKSLGSWVRDLQLRIDFISMWLTCGMPISIWVSGFFFPQGFMTGVLQRHARNYNLPIDQLNIDFEMMPSVTLDQEDIYQAHLKTQSDTKWAYRGLEGGKDGVLVHGLFLDAARFDSQLGVLMDPNPGELNPSLPVMRVLARSGAVRVEGRYEAPLYKTSVRAGVLSTTGHSTNFVLAVFLPSSKPSSYWILKGTALLTQITD